ncbi:hypothetical protein RP20_CCG019919 [Aedes albopictus]|nr:hypothetical protein RP20_CCG019919 [Aedes albopictus]
MLPLKAKKGRRLAPKTVSEKIHEQFVSAGAAQQSDEDEDEETRPRFSEFDENDDELERSASGRLSDIRKQNIRYLDAIDRKYEGKVSSRGDVFGDGSEDEEESGEESDDGSEAGYEPGAFVKLKPNVEEDEDGSGGEGESPEDDEDDDFDEDDDDDYDEDENDYSLGDFLESSRSESQKLLQDENRQESVQKGICVQNQLKMWERLLEIRIKMQSSLITANSFPHAQKFRHLCEDTKFQEATQKVSSTVESTLRNLLELQETLVGRFPETKNLPSTGSKRKLKPESKQPGGGKDKHPRLDQFEPHIRDSYVSYTPYRNEVLQKWHDRTKVASSSGGAKAVASLSIVKKIENALLSKDEVIRKTQLYRGGYRLFDEPTAAQRAGEDETAEENGAPDQIYDGEIYDDSDFYHALLRELIEYKSNTADNPQEIGAKLAELQKLRNKMKKQVDTRASKGRKIRYVVHKKLVNFTAPDDGHQWTEDAKNELFGSLFGGTASN